MSHKFDKQEIIDKQTELKADLATVLVDLQGTKNSVDYILNNAEFKGEFSENTKSYYGEVHGKAIEILTTLIEAIQLAGDELKQNADTLDSDKGAKIDTDYLMNEQKKEIQKAQDAYTTHKSAIQKQVSSIGDIISLSMPAEHFGDKAEAAKKELQTIKTKVDEFSENSVVDEISALIANFDSLMSYMDSCQTGNGNVKYAVGDLGKQPFYNDLDQNMKIVRGENIDEDAAYKEATQVLQAMTKEEQRKMYAEMCKELGVPETDEGFVTFFNAVTAGGMKLARFWETLFGTVVKKGYKADPKILSLISKRSSAEVFIEMVGKSNKMTDMFLNAAVKTEKGALYVKNGAVDYLMNLALKAEDMGDIVKREKYLNLAVSIDDGSTVKNLRHAIKLARETKDFSKLSGWLKNVNQVASWAKDSKWVGTLGKTTKVLGWSSLVATTSINAAENWEETNGNVGRTIAHTSIDAVCDVGPLEAMQVGFMVGGPYGAAIGFGVGAGWQLVQWGSKALGLGDIRKGLKGSVGNWTGDKMNDAGKAIKGASKKVGKAVSSAWRKVAGASYFV